MDRGDVRAGRRRRAGDSLRGGRQPRRRRLQGGLAAYLFTEFGEDPCRSAQRWTSATSPVNNVDAGMINAPYGGRRESGFGSSTVAKGSKAIRFERVRCTRAGRFRMLIGIDLGTSTLQDRRRPGGRGHRRRQRDYPMIDLQAGLGRGGSRSWWRTGEAMVSWPHHLPEEAGHEAMVIGRAGEDVQALKRRSTRRRDPPRSCGTISARRPSATGSPSRPAASTSCCA